MLKNIKKSSKIILHNQKLSIKNIGKEFKKKPILRSISLDVAKGEVVGLLGPNGAGKTTCFYIIMGLISADYGEIKLNGADITSLPMHLRARKGLGYLPQEISVFRGMSVEQNIRSILELVESSFSRREILLDELLAEFSISHLRRTPSMALSGGERRRVEIARALASQPEFLLLDEPLAGIDPVAVSEIRDLVYQVKNKNVGVLITDHNVRETLDLVDRAYIIHNGNIIKSGNPKEVVLDKSVRKVYLGESFKF